MRKDIRKPARVSRPLLMVLGILCGLGSLAGACAALARLVMMSMHWETFGIVAVLLGAVTYPLCARGLGPKRLVLFLRRFGNEELNAALLKAFREAIGRRYRIVTLDDSNFVPVGLQARILLISIAGAVALGMLVGTGATVALLPFVIDSQDPDHILFETEIAIGLCWLLSTIMAVAGALLYAIAFIYQRRERLSKIAKPKNLQSVLRSVQNAKRVRRTFAFTAPLARVVRATYELWKDSVTALAGASDVVIIDVSIPRENIAWELQQMTKLHVSCLVLRCEKDVPPADAEPAWRNDIERFTQDHTLMCYGAPDTLSWQALLRGIEKVERGHTRA